MKKGLNWGAIVTAVVFLGGCSSVPAVVPLVVPEQRLLDIRQPAEIPYASLPAVPEPATVSKPAPRGDAPMELPLDEAIRIGLANAQVVRVLAGANVVSSGKTIYDPAIANTAIDAARGVFDPVVVAKNAFNQTETPNAIFDSTSPFGARIPGTQIHNYELGLGISKKLVTGGTMTVDGSLRSSRFRPDVLNPLNPEESSSVTVGLTQPLLQGAGVRANVAPIVVARLKTEMSYFQFKDSMQSMVQGVIEAYWQVVFARTDVWARQQQVDQSGFAYERAVARKKFVTVGEIAQAKVSHYNFKAQLIAAEANLLQREAALRNILGLAPTEPERLVPTTAPNPDRIDPKWDEVLRLAEQNRPDLIELNLILEADEQNLLQARNQALPKVDAALFYRWNGLEGTTPSGARLATGAGQFTDWSAGVNFSVPLGLRQARANLRSAELILRTDRANLDQGLHSSLHILAGNVRNLAQYYDQYKAYREMRTAARVNLEQQIANFPGRTSYLNVLLAITDWGNAVSAEAQSLAQYNIELATLERQTGTILETHGIRLLEERYGSIGPLGRAAHRRLYPSSVVPQPNAERYRDSGEPAEKSLEKEVPSLKEPKEREDFPRPPLPLDAVHEPARLDAPMAVRTRSTQRR